MARKKSNFGQGLTRVLEATPPEMMRELLSAVKTPEDDLLVPPDLPPNLSEDDARSTLFSFLASQDRDVLTELEMISTGLLELSEGKGATSLDTIAGKRLLNVDHDLFEDQPDPLCRSIWVYIRFREIFHDAESFHAVRRYRDHRKMHAAFEVDLDEILEVNADQIDTDLLCRKLEERLDLKVRSSASVLELPETRNYPASVMIALRHPGALSSIQDHRIDGGWRTYYFRPSQEAVLVYTPKYRKIEVCSDSFAVRDEVAGLFADVVLQQDLSKKPLARRFFNLDRFRTSFRIDPPDYDDVEVNWAKVVEAEMPLGAWSRKLSVKVTGDENIEQVFGQYLRNSSRLVRAFGFNRIAIAVGFTWRSDRKQGTLRLTISNGNSSNVQSQRDPALRDIGYRLLSHWGLVDELRSLTEDEKARWFSFLLSLYDLPGREVSGVFFEAANVDPAALVKAGFIERKRRQALVLIDDGDNLVEGELQTGRDKGTVDVEGGFGEVLGAASDKAALIYNVDRPWLAETILKTVSGLLEASRIEIETEELASVGVLDIEGKAVPIFFARCLGDPKVRERLEVHLKQRRPADAGVVLSCSEGALRYLGRNVVIAMADVLIAGSDGLRIDANSLKTKYQAGQALVSDERQARVIRHEAQTATFIFRDRDPLHLGGNNQVTFMERLVKASDNGAVEVRATELTAGMSATSPRQVFGKRWKKIMNVYVSQGSSNRFWRLGGPIAGD